MWTELDAINYMKRQDRGGVDEDQAVAILDKMVNRHRKSLRIVDQDLYEMKRFFRITTTILVALFIVAPYLLLPENFYSLWVLLLGILPTTYFLVRTYIDNAEYHKMLVRKREELRASIINHSYIKIKN